MIASSFNRVVKKVLKEIIPTTKEIEFIGTIINELSSILTKKARILGINYTKIEPQGSTGIKQTQLRNDYDIDLFIGLDYSRFEQTYQELTKNKLKKEVKKDILHLCNRWIIDTLKDTKYSDPYLFYAEHPYVRVDYVENNIKIKIDIVLYFDLPLDYIKENGPITAVDRSPWHGRFIKQNLSEHQKNDVRLLKQFFKASYCYGDKSAVGRAGFIGYSAELLIYYYKSLQNVFKNFSKLPKEPLDYYNRSIEELQTITHFQSDYLIIVDPIDKNRNVASAISERAFKFCNYQVSCFLNAPDEKYFTILPIPLFSENILVKDEIPKFFVVELKNEDKKVHYTVNRDKLYSLGESIKNNGEKEYSHDKRFGRIEYELYFEDEVELYALAIYCTHPQISKSFMRKGPRKDDLSHARKFKERNPDFIEKGKYLWVEAIRDFDYFLDFLTSFISSNIESNFTILNVSKCINVKSIVGQRALYILNKMVLPFTELTS